MNCADCDCPLLVLRADAARDRCARCCPKAAEAPGRPVNLDSAPSRVYVALVREPATARDLFARLPTVHRAQIKRALGTLFAQGRIQREASVYRVAEAA